MTDHADFLAAAEERRWTRPLHELAVRLRETAWKAKGGWAWWILPGGACVSMRVVPDGEFAFQKELRISRREPLETFEQFKKWAQECKVFRGHLGCEMGWHTVTLAGQPSGQDFTPGAPTEWVTREIQPLGRSGEAKPALKCAKCGAVAEPGSDHYKETLCNKCALELGQKEQQASLDLQTEGDR